MVMGALQTRVANRKCEMTKGEVWEEKLQETQRGEQKWNENFRLVNKMEIDNHSKIVNVSGSKKSLVQGRVGGNGSIRDGNQMGKMKKSRRKGRKNNILVKKS